jgi:hypothetical protein
VEEIQNFDRESERERSLVRHGCRWEDNINTNLTEIGLEAQVVFQWRALVNTVMDFRVP